MLKISAIGKVLYTQLVLHAHSPCKQTKHAHEPCPVKSSELIQALETRPRCRTPESIVSTVALRQWTLDAEEHKHMIIIKLKHINR